MLFSSPEFFAFFVLFVIFIKLCPAQWSLGLVILGSMLFYAYWRPIYALLPIVLIFVAFGLTSWIYKSAPDRRRKRMIVSVSVLLFPLAFYKYAFFFCTSFVTPFVQYSSWVGALRQPLPLGISFITFTLISYLVDVGTRRSATVNSIKPLWASIVYFPHLIAGPIVRPSLLMPQFKTPLKDKMRRAKWVYGFSLFSLGLLKKLAIADQIAGPVNAIYEIQSLGGPVSSLEASLAILGFSVQIYCDFSGYTDMALGISSILGIQLPQNFVVPYGSASIIDFWRRWHITLSSWLRDYLYIPLGGNARGHTSKKMRNLMLTMILGGLWHGANWTFVIWGTIHGAALCLVHRMRHIRRSGLPKAINIACTFLFVTIAWVFFRAPSLEVACQMLFNLIWGGIGDYTKFARDHAYSLILILVFLLTHRFDRHSIVRYSVRKMPRAMILGLAAIAWMIAIGVSLGHSADFIYFEF